MGQGSNKENLNCRNMQRSIVGIRNGLHVGIGSDQVLDNLDGTSWKAKVSHCSVRKHTHQTQRNAEV